MKLFKLQEKQLKALAHAKRLEIINIIRDRELTVTDIFSMLDLPQANVSQHLMILRSAGVVKSRKLGKEIYYSLADVGYLTAYDAIKKVLLERVVRGELRDEMQADLRNELPIIRNAICNIGLSPKSSVFSVKYNGRKYFFCNAECQKAFSENPKEYVRNHKKFKESRACPHTAHL